MNKSKQELIKNAPEWFSLKNYDQSKNLDAYGWWLHLSRRMAALDAIERGYHYDLSKFFRNPVLNNSEINEIRNKLSWVSPLANDTPNAPKLKNAKLHTDTVRSLPLLWIAYGENDDQDVREAVDNFKSSKDTDTDADLLFTPYDLYLKSKGLNNNGLLLLEVDCNATDEKILADFSSWLKAARDEFGSVRAMSFTKATFQEWVSYGVLPYIDLTLWAKYNNVRLTQYAIGRAIYPDDDESCSDPTERIRRTTKAKADWLMNWALLRSLEIQANAEIKNRHENTR